MKQYKNISIITEIMSAELEKQYQKKTDKEHILDNPDTYIGSVENVDTTTFIFDEMNKASRNKDKSKIE